MDVVFTSTGALLGGQGIASSSPSGTPAMVFQNSASTAAAIWYFAAYEGGYIKMAEVTVQVAAGAATAYVSAVGYAAPSVFSTDALTLTIVQAAWAAKNANVPAVAFNNGAYGVAAFPFNITCECGHGMFGWRVVPPDIMLVTEDVQ